MTKEEQRFTIAEACGYAPAAKGALGCSRWVDPEHEESDIGDGIVYLNELPDYLNDLNAMHEAWLTCIKHRITKGGEPMQQHWRHWLRFIVTRDFEKVGYQSTSNATATQRAEAFLRTVGKWKD